MSDRIIGSAGNGRSHSINVNDKDTCVALGARWAHIVGEGFMLLVQQGKKIYC